MAILALRSRLFGVSPVIEEYIVGNNVNGLPGNFNAFLVEPSQLLNHRAVGLDGDMTRHTLFSADNLSEIPGIRRRVALTALESVADMEAVAKRDWLLRGFR